MAFEFARNIQDVSLNPATFALPTTVNTPTTSAAVDLGTDVYKTTRLQLETITSAPCDSSPEQSHGPIRLNRRSDLLDRNEHDFDLGRNRANHWQQKFGWHRLGRNRPKSALPCAFGLRTVHSRQGEPGHNLHRRERAGRDADSEVLITRTTWKSSLPNFGQSVLANASLLDAPDRFGETKAVFLVLEPKCITRN